MSRANSTSKEPQPGNEHKNLFNCLDGEVEGEKFNAVEVSMVKKIPGLD